MQSQSYERLEVPSLSLILLFPLPRTSDGVGAIGSTGPPFCDRLPEGRALPVLLTLVTPAGGTAVGTQDSVE